VSWCNHPDHMQLLVRYTHGYETQAYLASELPQIQTILADVPFVHEPTCWENVPSPMDCVEPIVQESVRVHNGCLVHSHGGLPLNNISSWMLAKDMDMIVVRYLDGNVENQICKKEELSRIQSILADAIRAPEPANQPEFPFERAGRIFFKSGSFVPPDGSSKVPICHHSKSEEEGWFELLNPELKREGCSFLRIQCTAKEFAKAQILMGNLLPGASNHTKQPAHEITFPFARHGRIFLRNGSFNPTELKETDLPLKHTDDRFTVSDPSVGSAYFLCTPHEFDRVVDLVQRARAPAKTDQLPAERQDKTMYPFINHNKTCIFTSNGVGFKPQPGERFVYNTDGFNVLLKLEILRMPDGLRTQTVTSGRITCSRDCFDKAMAILTFGR
jgi:hypothetical protein